MSIAFFDVDNTLMNGYAGFEVTLSLIKKGVLKKRLIPMAIFLKLITPIYKANVRKLYEMVAKDMAGMKIEDVLVIGKECFENKVKPKIYEEGIEKIAFHRKKKHPIYLVTSGPSMVVKFLADFLNVDGFFACGSIVEKGILTSRIVEPIYYRQGKIEAVKEVLRKSKVPAKNCYFYSDSADDLPVMKYVGHPVMVNPDLPLRQYGRSHKWDVLEFKKTLG